MRLLSQAFSFFFLAFYCGTTLARPIFHKQAMVTSAHPDATKAGVEILKQGGNAIDAAIATTLAISVVEPFSAGIGGGGFMLIHLAKDKSLKALDFREVAPNLSSKNMFQEKEGGKSSTNGHFAVAVPGTIAGLLEAHQKYGKLSWEKLFAPAIKLAAEGFDADSNFVDRFEAAKERLKGNDLGWKTFTKNKKPYQLGENVRQPELAESLKILSKNPNDFYEGKIALAIVQEMKKASGLISFEDLKEYKPKWRDPVCGKFLDSEICSMPPPSSGGILLLQMLNAVSELGSDNLPWHEPKTVETLSEIMKFAFHDRALLLGDPDFVKIPVEKLISREYAKEKLGQISADTFKESNDTSHLNVVDKDRNAVSLTFTVNLAFGSGVVVPGTGILLNNEMDDFSSSPNVPNAFGLVGGSANEIAPKKIPLSSMTPVIARKNGEFYFAVGSPGGSRIISTVFHAIMNQMVYKMNIEDAISAGRFHHQWMPDEISVETFALDPATISFLRKKGYKVESSKSWSNANMVVALPQIGLEGAIDRRGHGSAAGY